MTDRPMTDHLDRAAEVIEQATPADVPGYRMRYAVEAARALEDAGLLVTPERDAEVRADERAKVLAGFTEVHTLAWDGEPSMSGAPHRCSTAAEVDLETARRALSTVGRRKPNPRIERRLVGPWEPVDREQVSEAAPEN